MKNYQDKLANCSKLFANRTTLSLEYCAYSQSPDSPWHSIRSQCFWYDSKPFLLCSKDGDCGMFPGEGYSWQRLSWGDNNGIEVACLDWFLHLISHRRGMRSWAGSEHLCGFIALPLGESFLLVEILKEVNQEKQLIMLVQVLLRPYLTVV